MLDTFDTVAELEVFNLLSECNSGRSIEFRSAEDQISYLENLDNAILDAQVSGFKETASALRMMWKRDLPIIRRNIDEI